MRKMTPVILLVVVFVIPSSFGQDCQCGIEQVRRRVINGREAKEGQYPWMASVQSQMGSCGGSVINDRFILTAAHCVQNVKSPDQMKVILGAYRPADFNRIPAAKVKRIHQHEKYTGIESFHDIALLELEQPLQFNRTFVPICIANFKQYDNLLVTGWGLMNLWILKVQPQTLREADLPEVPTEKCKKHYSMIDGQKVICAGGDKGSCQGDSGGPLLTRKDGRAYQVGIVSFGGSDCGIVTKAPGVFERPLAHVDWIKQKTQGAKWCSAPGQAVGGSEGSEGSEEASNEISFQV